MPATRQELRQHASRLQGRLTEWETTRPKQEWLMPVKIALYEVALANRPPLPPKGVAAAIGAEVEETRRREMWFAAVKSFKQHPDFDRRLAKEINELLEQYAGLKIESR